MILLTVCVLLTQGFGVNPSLHCRSNLEKRAPQPRWAIGDMMNVRSVDEVRVSPDGLHVAYTVTKPRLNGSHIENLEQIFVASIDGQHSVPLTDISASCSNPRWSPDGQLIAFISSRGGQHDDVWFVSSGGGEPEQLTHLNFGTEDFRWSPDGDWIAYVTSSSSPTTEGGNSEGTKVSIVVDEDLPNANQIWIESVHKHSGTVHDARQLTAGSFNVTSGDFDWSPDGTSIVFSHTPIQHATDWTLSDISTVNVSTSGVRPITRSAAAEYSPLFSPDGQWIAFAGSDVPPSWAGDVSVFVVSSEGGRPRRLATTFDRKPTLIGWAADGTKVYFSEFRGTSTQLSALPTSGESPVVISDASQYVDSFNINSTRTMVGFNSEKSEEPEEGYVTELRQYHPVQISNVNADYRSYHFGRSERIRWPSRDGTEIEGILTYPLNYVQGKRYPLVVILHGGPAGVFVSNFIGDAGFYPVAAFSDRGFAVLRCNVRGSDGYGKKFRFANYLDWGGGDLDDVMSGVNHLISKNIADPSRLGLMGWSYGGYLTLRTISQTKRFQAASVGGAISDLVSFAGTTEIPTFVSNYLGGMIWEKPMLYRTRSPIYRSTMYRCRR